MIRRTGILILGLFLLTANSCKKDKLNPNDVYSTDKLKIEFKDYTDSRCPHNADCIWAGEAEVFLEAKSGDETASFSLIGIGADTVLFNHSIEFVDLLPYPESGVEVPFEDKELILHVTEL